MGEVPQYYSPYVDEADSVSDDAVSNSIMGYTRRARSPLSTDLSDSEAGLESSDDDNYYESRLRRAGDGAWPNPSGRNERRDAPQRNDFLPPDRAELYRLGSPSLADPRMREMLDTRGYAAFDMSGVKIATKNEGRGGIDYGNSAFKTQAGGETSLLMINSEDRDRVAYPQPTQFQLHFPKVYRNVTSFQVTQIKLLSAFLYFREQKYNTYFDVWEQGRTLPNGDSNIIRVRIREGSYNITTLLNELQLQMNTPPIFFHFPNNFNDFAAAFSVNGDLALNFNLPGDYFYDALLQRYVPNPTTDYIVTRYFASRYAGQSSYTLSELLVAYYYPVLKEALLDAEEALKITLPSNDAEAFVRIVFGFQGLDDPYVLAVIQSNIVALDAIRDRMTFQYALVNNYNWTYQTFNNRITVSSSNLNTSLVNLITLQSNTFLSNALVSAGLTLAQYQALITQINRQNAVLVDMYNYLQAQLANVFAVNFGSYTLPQLASPTSQILIQDGCNVSGVYASYTPGYIEAINNGTIKPLPDFDYKPAPPAIQWPNMSNFSTPTTDITFAGGSTFINFIAGNKFNLYDFTLSNIDPNITFTDSNGIIQAGVKYGSAEVVANISAGTYAIFGFRSPARQTLQVETLPRPYIYRYKDYNDSAYGGAIPFYFNKEYEFNYLSSMGTVSGSNLNYISSLSYGTNYDSTIVGAPFYVQSPIITAQFFQVYMPTPPPIYSGPDVVGYDYTLNFDMNFEGANPNDSKIYIYHDKAAFMADAANVGSENMSNYLAVQDMIFTDPSGNSISSVTITQTVLAATNYYFIIQPLNSAYVPPTNYKFYAYWEDATSTPRKLLSNFDIQQAGVNNWAAQFGLNYDDTPSTVNKFFYKTYNSNYIQLPIQTTLYGSNPSQQQFNVIYPSDAPFIGYSESYGSSGDLTDYKGFVAGNSNFQPSTLFSCDPITGWVFQSKSPYNQTTQNYLYTGSSNQLLYPELLFPVPVDFNSNLPREYKIVHYYDPTFIGPQTDDAGGWSLTDLSTLVTMSPYTATTTGGAMTGYSYTFDAALGTNTLRLGRGVTGITFLPSEGLWDIQKFTFKSAYMGTNDPNDAIAYIAIYDTNSITNTQIGNINIENALAILIFDAKVEYTAEVVAANNGFDPSYGTWRQFRRATDSDLAAVGLQYNRPDLVAQGLPGYTPYPSTIVSGERNLYTAVPFNASFAVTTYFMLCGSAIPNPQNGTVSRTTDYLGFTAPGGVDMAFPINPVNWNTTCNFYQSRYQQSIPIGTQVINYNGTLELYQDNIYNYNPFGGFVGDPTFVLRTANYFEGSNHYLLFGDKTGAQPQLCDVYFVRNAGGDPRETVFVNQFDLSSYVPVGEQFITFGANSSAVYIMTRVGAPQNVKIYRLTNLTTAPSVVLYQSLELIGQDFRSNNYANYPQFDLAAARIQVTDRGDWLYTDAMNMSSITGPASLITDMAGIFQYNKEPTISTFTTVAYSASHFFDATTHPAISYSYILKTNPAISYETVEKYRFSTSAVTDNTLNGLYFNLSNAGYTTLENLFQIGPAYYPYLSNIMANSLNELYGLSYANPTRFQKLIYLPTATTFESNVTLQGSFASISSISGTANFGYGMDPNNGIWFTYQLGPVTDPVPIQILGNTQLNNDVSYGMRSAYQIFYPTLKIQLTKRANRYNDITNLVDLDYFGTPYYENYKTEAFFYSNFNSMMSDLSNAGGWKWGMESNFARGDTNFQGYGFNSYVYNISLQTSGNINMTPSPRVVNGLVGDPNNYSWVAIRGYSPTEDFQTLVRFNLANRYDYGLLTQPNIIQEISSALSTVALPNFNPNYVDDLLAFNSNFILTSNYGENALSNFAGVVYTTTSYSNWYSLFSTNYAQYYPSSVRVYEIQSNVNSNLINYLSTYFGTILPSSIYDRLRLTDAIPFSLLFSTSVAPQVACNDTNWGLGYNLGFARCNYSNNTTYTAPSFYKILDDYIYLMLNDELSMNRMDVTARENYNITLESTGEVNKYNAKLLLANFGNYSQTAIQNPVQFNPPLSRLDRLTFTWVDINGNVIDNNDCEWSACLQITEQKDKQTVDSTLARR